MAIEERIITLLEEKFKEEDYQDFFVVEITENPANKKVEVFIESDSGVTINKCAKLNRYLQKHIDEAGWLGEKYILDVSSPGVGKPLKHLRQYHKNIGRTVKVTLQDGKTKEGILLNVEEERFTIQYKVKKKEGKKNKVELIEEVFEMENIQKTIVLITF